MDTLFLSRVQFGLTAGFHFLFPPLTIGMAWFIVWIMTRYVRTADEFYGRMARFWTRLFVVTFAIGVATGITMEFQFGTNWSEYSRYVGDIFGAPLAAEALLSFFLESTFIAVLIFGWNRLSRRTLWFASLMVAVGATLSAFWIIVANSWQQTPAGYHIVGGRAELTSFVEAVFNPSTVPRYLHTMAACFMTGAFFMLGVSAWFLLKGRDERFARESFRLALIGGFIFSVAQLPIGHHHTVQVVHTQPTKLAAIEGLFDSEQGAGMLLFGFPDPETQRVRAAVKIPKMLSLLAYGDPNAEVRGLNAFPREDWPPIPYTYYTFHIMVYIGGFLILYSSLGLLMLRGGRVYGNRLFLCVAVLSIPLPQIANQLGWFSAEVGRQPWIVWGLKRTSEMFSPNVPAGQVLFSIIMFTIIYAFLFAVWVYLLVRLIKKGPTDEDGLSPKEV
jgi:cytochrome d ubiquinol oxidase subunit I